MCVIFWMTFALKRSHHTNSNSAGTRCDGFPRSLAWWQFMRSTASSRRNKLWRTAWPLRSFNPPERQRYHQKRSSGHWRREQQGSPSTLELTAHRVEGDPFPGNLIPSSLGWSGSRWVAQQDSMTCSTRHHPLCGTPQTPLSSQHGRPRQSVRQESENIQCRWSARNSASRGMPGGSPSWHGGQGFHLTQPLKPSTTWFQRSARMVWASSHGRDRLTEHFGGSRTPCWEEGWTRNTFMTLPGTASGSSSPTVPFNWASRETRGDTWETGWQSPRQTSTPGRRGMWWLKSGKQWSMGWRIFAPMADEFGRTWTTRTGIACHLSRRPPHWKPRNWIQSDRLKPGRRSYHTAQGEPALGSGGDSWHWQGSGSQPTWPQIWTSLLPGVCQMLSTLWLPLRLASGFSSSGGGLGIVLFFGGQPDWWLSGHSFRDRKGHSGDFEGGCRQMNLPPGRLHPPLVVGDLAIPWESCGIHSPTAWVPSRWPPSDWLGFGPSEGITLLIHWILTSPANRPGLHKLAPRSQNKRDAFVAEGCCLWGAFIRRTFLVTCWHFLFAWKLAGEQEYVCNVHLSKMSPFWLKWAWSEWSVWKNPPTTPRVGHGCWTTCETSEGDSRKPQRGCGQVAQISPSLTDLQADPMSPTDLKFKDGENGFDQQGSNFTAMRMYQAVMQAKNMFQAGMATGTATAGPVGSLRSNLDALCDRVALEKDWTTRLEPPSHALSFRGVMPFWRNSSSTAPRGRLGTSHPSTSCRHCRRRGNALQRATGNSRSMLLRKKRRKKNVQTHRLVDNWRGCTRSSVTTSSCVCWLSHNSNSLIWARVTLMNGMTGSMAPRLQEGSLLPLRRPCCGQSGMHGDRSVNWWPMVPLSKGLWNKWKRTSYSGPSWVYERIMFQQLRVPKDPKGKGKGKGKGKTKSGKGVYQDHLKSSPSGYKGGGKDKGPNKGGRPSGWPANWALQSPTGVPFWSTFARATVTDPMPAQSESMVGPAMGITPLISAPTKANLEPSRDLELTAHRDRRAGRRILRMKSQSRLRQTGSMGWHPSLCRQLPLRSFPNQYQILPNRGRRQL